jgi:hypothetical protein
MEYQIELSYLTQEFPVRQNNTEIPISPRRGITITVRLERFSTGLVLIWYSSTLSTYYEDGKRTVSTVSGPPS